MTQEAQLKACPNAEAIAQQIADRTRWKKSTDTYARIYQAAYAAAILTEQTRIESGVVAELATKAAALLDATERHVFGDECAKERDEMRTALAKHGITLAPEKDWATELWADLMDAWNYKSWAQGIRDGIIVDADQKAIALIRERVVLKERV